MQTLGHMLRLLLALWAFIPCLALLFLRGDRVSVRIQVGFPSLGVHFSRTSIYWCPLGIIAIRAETSE